MIYRYESLHSPAKSYIISHVFSRVVVALIMNNANASTADDVIRDSRTLYLSASDQRRATHNSEQATLTQGLQYINDV